MRFDAKKLFSLNNFPMTNKFWALIFSAFQVLLLNPFYFEFQPPANGYLLEVVDNEWRQDELPFDHITVPSEELPDPEADNSDPLLTMSEQVNIARTSRYQTLT